MSTVCLRLLVVMQHFSTDGYKSRWPTLMLTLRTMVSVHMQRRKQKHSLWHDHEAHKQQYTDVYLWAMLKSILLRMYVAISGTSNQLNLAAENSSSLSF
jgi:hypothetical protein